ncbi:MAG: Ig-like domain-containing protein [Planctomycetota bacterium]
MLKNRKTTSLVATLLISALAVVGAGCGSGGNGGAGGAGQGDALLSFITIEGISGTLGPTDNPDEVAVNAAIFFTFQGPVDLTSLPADGAADSGSIRITNNATGAGAMGTWKLQTGDPKTVVFTAFPPLGAADPCLGGLVADATYTIFIPNGAGGLQNVIYINGSPIQEAVLRQFTVSTCNVVDPNPGDPIIVSTTPAASMAAPGVDQSATAVANPNQSQVVIDFNEPIDPATISEANIVLLNTTAGSEPIPVALAMQSPLVFQQFGTVIGQQISRLTINAGSLFTENDIYEIRLTGVTDLGGNPVVAPAGSLLFTINDNPATTPQNFTFADNFDTTANFLESVGAISWIGDGTVTATFPIEIVGTGDDGVGTFNTSGLTINTDNFTSGSVSTMDGFFNFTNLTINGGNNPGFTISFSSTTDVSPAQSNYSVNIRATGTVTIGANTVISCDGRPGAAASSSPNAASVSQPGGWGGPGGGNGGNSSPNTDGTISLFGLGGTGAKTDPADSTIPGNTINFAAGTALFGGGGGGQVGAGPTTTQGAGGGGGGAASSFAGYTVSDPPNFAFAGPQAGEIHAGSPQAPGAAGTFPPAFIPPFLNFAPAGSGGGAGGDRIVSPTLVSTHVPGGAGGGGGGSIRISAGGAVTFGNVTQTRCRGGAGGAGTLTLLGRGGGGSGGSIWVQTFATIGLGNGASFFCDGGAGGTNFNPALDGDGGRGGDGVIQLEDGNTAALLSALSLGSIVQGELALVPFSFTDDVIGTAFTSIIDSGSNSTDYTSGMFTVLANGATTGMAEVMVLGIAENPNQPGQPATTAMTASGFSLMRGPVPLANVSDINGFRFFQLQLVTTFPAPGTGPGAPVIGDPLPALDDVTVNYTR